MGARANCGGSLQPDTASPNALHMSRVPFATLAILLLVIGWICAAAVLADSVRPLHWAIQVVYYAIAGFAWVFPVRWMMLWGARMR